MPKINLPDFPYQPALYAAATPIGNLGDITLRTLQALSQAHLILAEDTRRIRKLLTHYEIHPQKLLSFHEHSTITDRLIENIKSIINAEAFALLVSDAGTPLISDPGFALIRVLRAESIPVLPLPGPSSLTAILSVAALPCHRFCFGGFLPNKREKRKKYLNSFNTQDGSLIFFESPQRLIKTLEDMAEVFGGERKLVIAREMTKKFEEVKEASIQEMLALYQHKTIKGEITLMVAPK